MIWIMCPYRREWSNMTGDRFGGLWVWASDYPNPPIPIAEQHLMDKGLLEPRKIP